MGANITKNLGNIETNIERCKILHTILRYKKSDREMDIDKYIQRGYSEEEIMVGSDLIDLYLMLQSLVEKANTTM